MHEQNSVEGSSNRLLSFLQKIYCISISKTKNTFFGNQQIYKIKRYRYHQDDNLNILITGGSQGADFINKNIPTALNTLNIKLNVIHQCGLGRCKMSQTITKKLMHQFLNL